MDWYSSLNAFLPSSGHSQRAPRVQMKIRKRISLTDDMARTREDDSDTEINLSFNGMSFTDDENVPVANTEHAESESISQSESFNSSPVEVWDLSPKSVSISEGLETSIAESKFSSNYLNRCRSATEQ